MPHSVREEVIHKINGTRQNHRGGKWQPSQNARICNVHYLDFKGPSKGNRDAIPVYFKVPNSCTFAPLPKRRKLLQRQCAISGNADDSSLSDHGSLSTEGICNDTGNFDVTSCGNDAVQSSGNALQFSDSKELSSSVAMQSDNNVLQSDDNALHSDGNALQSNGGAVQSSDNALQSSGGVVQCGDNAVQLQSGDNAVQLQSDDNAVQLQSDDNAVRSSDNVQQLTDATQSSNTVVEETSTLTWCLAKLRQENAELRLENLQLKRTIETLNITVQRLNLSLLSDNEVLMYTGISRKIFDCLVAWLKPVSQKKRASDELTPTQKLLLVLMRLCQNFPQGDLAVRFNIDQSSVSRILNQWIPLLRAQLKALIRWPQSLIGPTEPPYNLLPNAVGIIDGTEIFIQLPSNLETQKSSFSDYKSHNTVKYLVGIDTFTGFFIFSSPGFSGNSSDRFTIQHSWILDELKPGQRILADKGYNALDLFAQKRSFLTNPSFLSGGRLSAQEGMQSRLIASARIRVENAIKRIKEYKVFSETLPTASTKKLLMTCISLYVN